MRVTEFLIQLERDNLIIRDQHHLIVRRDLLENFLSRTHSGSNSRNTYTHPVHFKSRQLERQDEVSEPG